MNAFYLVWRDWGFVPEEYDFVQWQLSMGQAGSLVYPLRPSSSSRRIFCTARRDDSWLWAGQDFSTRCKVRTARLSLPFASRASATPSNSLALFSARPKMLLIECTVDAHRLRVCD